MIPTVPLIEIAIGLILIGTGSVWLALTGRSTKEGQS